MRSCDICEWCDMLTNSDGQVIYICMNTDSGAYFSETGLGGSCDLDDAVVAENAKESEQNE